MKIRLIIPITGITHEGISQRLDYLRSIASPGTKIDAVQILSGPPAIESEVDGVEAGPGILKLVEEAENDGCDAAIIWCGSDPALRAARELVDIPVVGPGESMRLIASMLGDRPCGVAPDIPVLEMRRDLKKTTEAICSAIVEKIEKGDGDSFYLGCLALWGLGKTLREALRVPVIDGAESSLVMAEAAARLGLRHSRMAYPKHPPKHRI